MINKAEAKARGYDVKESNSSIAEEKQQKLAQLKALIPALVNSDGAVDVNAIKGFVGAENTTSNNKGYELTFAGKGLAKAVADVATTKELKIEKKQSKDFDKTENVIIRGDNLDVLKLLHKNYFNKIKMIYIDPPYNTGSDAFVYDDNFKQNTEDLIETLGLQEETLNYLNNMYGTQTHSGWLSFIYPRLKLARDLLTDDGVMFISIDDNEQANLKIICDEIFGEENFISQMVWQTKQAARGVPTTTMIIPNFEYILCYGINKNSFCFTGEERNKNEFANPDNDIRGLWRSESMKSTVPSNSKLFSIVDPKTKISYEGTWAFSNATIQSMIKEGLVIFPKDADGVPRQKKFINSYKNETKAIVSNLGWFSTETATKKHMSLFDNKKIFDFPKPTDLIQTLIKQGTDKDDIILDFFAGSGTTAHAVMALNKDDSGTRKFILVQLDEKISKEKSPPAYNFCKENNLEPVISSICIERVNLAGDKIKKELMLLDGNLDIGYKVFSLTDRPTITGAESQSPQLNVNRKSAKDTLYNMLVLGGAALLTEPIEELEPDVLYKVDNSYYLLGDCKTDLKKANRVFINGYADISLKNWLNTLGLDKEKVVILY